MEGLGSTRDVRVVGGVRDAFVGLHGGSSYRVAKAVIVFTLTVGSAKRFAARVMAPLDHRADAPSVARFLRAGGVMLRVVDRPVAHRALPLTCWDASGSTGREMLRMRPELAPGLGAVVV